MKIIFFLFLLGFSGIVFNRARAANIIQPPVVYFEKPVNLSATINHKILTLHGRAVRGRTRTSFREKIALKIVKWRLKHGMMVSGEPTEQQKKQARLSLIFSLLAYVLVFIPVVPFLSVPLAVFALILGIKSLKYNDNTMGILGVVFSGLYLLLILLAIALFIGYLRTF